MIWTETVVSMVRAEMYAGWRGCRCECKDWIQLRKRDDFGSTKSRIFLAQIVLATIASSRTDSKNIEFK